MQHPKELSAALVSATKLPEPVIARQLERTDLSFGPIGKAQKDTILAAGEALQKAGVVAADVNVPAQVDALIDGQYLVVGQ